VVQGLACCQAAAWQQVPAPAVLNPATGSLRPLVAQCCTVQALVAGRQPSDKAWVSKGTATWEMAWQGVPPSCACPVQVGPTLHSCLGGNWQAPRCRRGQAEMDYEPCRGPAIVFGRWAATHAAGCYSQQGSLGPRSKGQALASGQRLSGWEDACCELCPVRLASTASTMTADRWRLWDATVDRVPCSNSTLPSTCL